MKTDLYTKSVLTIIASCLLILVAVHLEIIPAANAKGSLSSNGNPLNYGLVPLNADGTIDVNIKSSSYNVKVEVADITTYDKLNINIEDVDSYAFSSCTVPVKIKNWKSASNLNVMIEFVKIKRKTIL